MTSNLLWDFAAVKRKERLRPPQNDPSGQMVPGPPDLPGYHPGEDRVSLTYPGCDTAHDQRDTRKGVIPLILLDAGLFMSSYSSRVLSAHVCNMDSCLPSR